VQRRVGEDSATARLGHVPAVTPGSRPRSTPKPPITAAKVTLLPGDRDRATEGAVVEERAFAHLSGPGQVHGA
jgi:hypothetical protein